jgi:tetratricopeptide (TPR) repeat protein
MERIVADRNIPMHSSLYSLGRRQFEENLKDILEKCRRAHVPVIVSEQVSNVRGQAPFISDKSGQDPSSEELFKTARSLESERQYGQARETYTQAKDMDQLRFRASEDFNELIHSLADEYKAPVVPMKQYFENAAPHGLVGNTLMVDHLHPNIEGYFLMADAFYQTMKLNHLIQNEWPEWSLSNSQLMRDWGITELDTLYADLSIRYLKGGWPFKPRTIPNTSLDNYHPKDKVQELALKALVDKDFGIELAHVHLADHYEKKGELDLALKEYRALMDMVPDEGEFYEKAAKINIHQKKFPEAYGLLRRAQVVRESDFTTKWIGQLLLAQNKLVEARPYLEKALSRAPGDPQLLFNLARLYILTMQFDKADPLIGNLQKFKDPKVTELQALEKKMIPVARQLKEAAILLK